MEYMLTKSIYDVVTNEILVPAGVMIKVTEDEFGLVGLFADVAFEVYFWQIAMVC